jgi:hypothetical protein
LVISLQFEFALQKPADANLKQASSSHFNRKLAADKWFTKVLLTNVPVRGSNFSLQTGS